MTPSDVHSIEAKLDAVSRQLEQLKQLRRREALPALLTLDLAAQQLSCGMTKLRQLVREKQLRTVLLGRRPMVPASEILRLSTPAESPKRGRPPKRVPTSDLSDEQFRKALRRR